MKALSTISIVVIEMVSEANASRGPPQREARAQHRPHRQRVAEDEGEHDREHDRGGVAPAERGRDDHAEHLADGAAGEAVQGRLHRAPGHVGPRARWCSRIPRYFSTNTPIRYNIVQKGVMMGDLYSLSIESRG